MPKITNVEFLEFSANHHNASRNWLVIKLNTDNPKLFGLGDASAMEDENEELNPLLVHGQKSTFQEKIHWNPRFFGQPIP